MNQMSARVVLAVAGVLFIVAAPAVAGVLPAWQGEDSGGVQAEMTKAQRFYQRGVASMNNSRALLKRSEVTGRLPD